MKRKTIFLITTVAMLISGCGAFDNATQYTNEPTPTPSDTKTDVTVDLNSSIGPTTSVDFGKITHIENSENGDAHIYYNVEKKIYSSANGDNAPTYTNQGDTVCVALKDCYIDTKFSTWDTSKENQTYIPEIGDIILFVYGNDSSLDKYVEKKDGLVKLSLSDPEQKIQQCFSIKPLEYSGLVTGEITSITKDNKINIRVTKERDVFTKDSQITVSYLWASTKTTSETVSTAVDFTDYFVFNPDFSYPEFESSKLEVGDTICFKYGKQDATDYENSPEDYVFKPLVVTVLDDTQ